MMGELRQIKESLKPELILFVADGMSGQDAVTRSEEVAAQVEFDGVVLKKLDGGAGGGAARSCDAATNKPIVYASMGESIDTLELLHPDRMAGRILGMGDVVTLVEKAQSVVNDETALKMKEKFRKQTFTLEDFLEQLNSIKKMGPMQDLLGMIPGMGNKMKDIQLDDRALTRIESIILSMNPDERNKPGVRDGSSSTRN